MNGSQSMPCQHRLTTSVNLGSGGSVPVLAPIRRVRCPRTHGAIGSMPFVVGKEMSPIRVASGTYQRFRIADCSLAPAGLRLSGGPRRVHVEKCAELHRLRLVCSERLNRKGCRFRKARQKIKAKRKVSSTTALASTGRARPCHDHDAFSDRSDARFPAAWPRKGFKILSSAPVVRGILEKSGLGWSGFRLAGDEISRTATDRRVSRYDCTRVNSPPRLLVVGAAF